VAMDNLSSIGPQIIERLRKFVNVKNFHWKDF